MLAVFARLERLNVRICENSRSGRFQSPNGGALENPGRVGFFQAA